MTAHEMISEVLGGKDPKDAVSEARGSKLQVGDKVQYSAKFLRSSGILTGEIPRAKGVIVKLDAGFGPPPGLATIKWDTPGVPEKVLGVNLKKIGTLEAD